MHTVAVVLAGGTGRRFGAGLPKQMRLLDGRSLVARCVETFAAAPAVDEVLVVAAAELADEIRGQLSGVAKLAGVITGGAGRPDSTQRAISWLSGRSLISARSLPVSKRWTPGRRSGSWCPRPTRLSS